MAIKNIFIICFSLIISFSAPSWANSGSCPVTLVVAKKQADVVLSHGMGGTPEKMHSLFLKFEQKVPSKPECAAYSDTDKIHLNNVEQHDVAFQSLEEGDVLIGTLNYHRPSPHGKFLHDDFHYGLRLVTVKKEDSGQFIDYSEQYIYFRHIGLY